MSTHNIHFHDKIGKNPKTSLNICFLELSEEFSREIKNNKKKKKKKKKHTKKQTNKKKTKKKKKNKKKHTHTHTKKIRVQFSHGKRVILGLGGSVGCASDWRPGGRGFDPAEVGNILSWKLIMKYFLKSFSPFRWFKKGSCQFLAKECAQ